ncbi:Hypothetical predicted protein [Octopus vulgaris]|uniref:Secreted protein n=1 Tax=Octopus vulgaris TaxID=6645 RepID=A0AA36ATX9_OCTVU|nr:Hypothetical predicted protein [Octopus vulgaris]
MRIVVMLMMIMICHCRRRHYGRNDDIVKGNIWRWDKHFVKFKFILFHRFSGFSINTVGNTNVADAKFANNCD